MRDPWQWEAEDVRALIDEQRKEDLRLEYKRSDALSKAERQKMEITKDVSAMANSAGGTIIYGIDEQKNSGGPIKLDSGIDPKQISTEWLEQVIDSGIQRRIDGLRVHAVKVSDTDRFVYVVWIPQSSLAPHMAADHRYHKRLGTTTTLMEEYEVRDVGRRAESPDLHLDLTVLPFSDPSLVRLEPRIQNSSPEPALYATCRLYFEQDLTPKLSPNLNWSRLEDEDLIWDDARIPFHVLRYSWAVPVQYPIIEGESYVMDHVLLDVGFEYRKTVEGRDFKIGWEIRTPKALYRLGCLKLIVRHAVATVAPQPSLLARI
jgi:hypothetical protein